MTDSTSIPLPLRSLLMGVLSGSRSMTPLAMLAVYRDRGDWGDWPVLRSQAGRAALVLAAVGELVGDKLPMAPSRTTPGPLLARVATGAITGAALGTLAGPGGWRQGAALGAVGAVVGSFAGSGFRAGGAAIGVPDVVLALVEDAVTVASSAAVVAAD